MDAVAAFAHHWGWSKEDTLALCMEELNGYMERLNEFVRRENGK